MKGYKVLHKSKEIEELFSKRTSMEKLIQSLHSLEDQTSKVIYEISQCLTEVENKSKDFLSNLISSFDHFLTVFNSKKFDYSQYHCSCGFLSNFKYEYSKHFAQCYKACKEFSHL
jgi:hypothetical protein